MHREQIKALALANGFKLKPQPDGSEDLNPYVYEFAEALLEPLRTVNEIAISDLHSCKLALGKALQEQEQLQAQLTAAKRCMDSAKNAGAKMMEIGQKLAAENSPEVIESERKANAMLTAENEALQAEVERLRADVQAEKSVKETIVAQRNRAYEVNDAHLKRIAGLEQERDQLKATLQRFMELDQNDRDLPLELWSVQRGVSPVDVSLAQRDAEVIKNAGDYLHKMGLINSNAHLMLKHHANLMLCASNQAKEVQS